MGFLTSLFGGSSQKSKSVANPAQVWSGQSPYLQQMFGTGQATLEAQLNRNTPAGNRFDQNMGTANDTWRNLMAGAQNPYLQGMANSAFQGVQDQFAQMQNELLGGGNAAGQLGGERFGALQAQNLRAGADALTGVANNIYGNAWNSGLQAQQDALANTGAIQNMAWQPLQNQAALLGAPTVLDQGGWSKASGSTSGGIVPGLSSLFKGGGSGSGKAF